MCFFMKKKVCLPTNPKNIGDIAENKTYTSFDVIDKMVIYHFILETHNKYLGRQDTPR